MKRFINFVLIILIISMLLASISSTVLFICLIPKIRLRVDESLLCLPNDDSRSIIYYYGEGEHAEPLIYEDCLQSSGSKYIYTPISRIPQRMINAFIAIEDKRFYSHRGVDPIRSMRAACNYILKRSSTFGASTITQQVVKNITGRNERTAARKINEVFMAINLERSRTKDEILEIYLNVINLSNGCMGVGAASEFYFSKIPSELSLSQTATIAAITNNPSYYDPINKPQNTLKRRNTVLHCMLEQGYITREEYDIATADDIMLSIHDSRDDDFTSWFTETVISDLLNDFLEQGYTKQYAYSRIFHGGLKIYSTVDPKIQGIAEKYYEELDKRLTRTDGVHPQSSIIIMDQRNGDILGVVGAAGKKRGELLQNYATATQRPPGSAIKPLSVYAPLIDSGEISWSTIIDDSPVTQINGRDWPLNGNRIYKGNITVAEALASSTNTAAVKLLYQLGEQRSLSFMRNELKIKGLKLPSGSSDGDKNAVSLALGQTKEGITLRELTGGYTIFASGIMSTPRSYYKVTDASGEVIIDKRNNQTEVIKASTASIMTKLMEEVVKDGTARGRVSVSDGVAVAGKTGTTQNNCDRLFVGYTPSLLAGVWCGYDYPKPLDASLGNISVNIWNDVINDIYKTDKYSSAPRGFNYSENICRLTYSKKSGLAPTAQDSPQDLADGWFVVE